MARRGVTYLRTTRGETQVLYGPDEAFPIGGSKVLRQSDADAATIVAAGITLHEALAAYELLAEKGIRVRVVDCYSVKPMDRDALVEAARLTGLVVTVEDHYAEGGLGEAVGSALAASGATLVTLAVRKMPRSGKPGQLLEFEEISRLAIAAAVMSHL